MDRNLDGCYFRVKRGEKYKSICFSDLDKDEKDMMTKDRNAEWLRCLCYHLAERLKEIGDLYDIIAWTEEDDEE